MVRQKLIAVGGTMNSRRQRYDAAIKFPGAAIFTGDFVEIYRMPEHVGTIFFQIQDQPFAVAARDKNVVPRERVRELRDASTATDRRKTENYRSQSFHFLPNVKDEPRQWPARRVPHYDS